MDKKTIDDCWHKEKLIKKLVSDDNMDGVKYLFENGYMYVSEGINRAIKENKMNFIEYFVGKDPTISNTGMIFAAKYGNKNLVDYFIKKGATCFDLALNMASKYNHKKLTDFFMSKTNNKNIQMMAAVRIGDKYMMDKLIKNKVCNWDDCLAAATEKNNMELIKFFIKKGARDYDYALLQAIENNNIPLMIFYIKKGIKNFNTALCVAYETKNVEAIEILKNASGQDIYDNDELPLYAGNRIMKEMIRKNGTVSEFDIEDMIEDNNINMIKFLIKNNKYNLSDGGDAARTFCHMNMAEFLDNYEKFKNNPVYGEHMFLEKFPYCINCVDDLDTCIKIINEIPKCEKYVNGKLKEKVKEYFDCCFAKAAR